MIDFSGVYTMHIRRKTEWIGGEESPRKNTARAREGRRAFCGVALMAAMGLSISTAILTAPAQKPAVKAAALPMAAAEETIALQQGDLSGFYKNDALITLSLPDVEIQAAFIRKAFRGDPVMAVKSDFSDYTSRLSSAQREKARALQAAQTEAQTEAQPQSEPTPAPLPAALPAAQTAAQTQQAAAMQQAMEAQQAAIRQSSGYVGLNNQGVPMSEKTGDVALDENGVPLQYSRCITAIATAYSSDPITSTGTVPVQGTVAVDPAKIPYGTRMWITSADGQYVYGLAVAEDTGGFIYMSNGPAADLYMYSEADCDNWGWRTANIYILD